jgi:hypothetical protein
MTESGPTIGLVDNMFAPEIFVDGAWSFSVINGVVRIVLTSVRSPQSVTAPGVAVPVIVGRLVMPVNGAQALAIGLNDFLEKQGLSPTAAATAGDTKQ